MYRLISSNPYYHDLRFHGFVEAIVRARAANQAGEMVDVHGEGYYELGKQYIGKWPKERHRPSLKSLDKAAERIGDLGVMEYYRNKFGNDKAGTLLTSYGWMEK